MKLFAVVLLAVLPAFSWNLGGHKIIAAICYDQLPGHTRDRVDAIIRQHPEYAKWTKYAKGRPERWAFIQAAVWADDIRSDPRFYNDTSSNPVPTPTLQGYIDMKRHTNWHYKDLNFSTDGTAFPEDVEEPNVVTQIRVAAMELQGPQATYYLPWLEHLVGDIHQPLHDVARWTAWNKNAKGRLQGDAGGNGVNVDGFTNLHTVWDDLLGNVDDGAYIEWMARRLRKENRPEANPDLDPEHWWMAGAALAQTEAYKFPAEVGSAANPFRRTPEYVQNALTVARKQAALAGYRMAALIAQQLP